MKGPDLSWPPYRCERRKTVRDTRGKGALNMGKKNFTVKESRISHGRREAFHKKKKLVANLPMCAHVSPFLPHSPQSCLRLNQTLQQYLISSITNHKHHTELLLLLLLHHLHSCRHRHGCIHFDMNSMNIDVHDTKTTRMTMVFSFFVFFHALLYSISINTGWFTLCASVLPVAGVLLTAALLVVAARATLMTWITVLVLLAFLGKRRRFLALQGRKITADVAVYVVKVGFRGKGLVALVCATFLSFLLIIAR